MAGIAVNNRNCPGEPGEGFEDMLRRKPSVNKLARHTGFRPATPLREIVLRAAGVAPPPNAPA